MGCHCSKVTTNQVVDHREPRQCKSATVDSILSVANVEIKKFMTDTTEQWITEDLEIGSSISVKTSGSPQYWVWERSWDRAGEPLWRFRIQRIPKKQKEDLYITYDLSNNKINMQPSGSNSYFSVNGGKKGGYIFRVPGEQRYISENEKGMLILSSTATEWTLIVDIEAEMTAAVRKDILIVKEYSSSLKWVFDDSVPEMPYVALGLDYRECKKNQWSRQYDRENGAWNFRSQQNLDLFVTCESDEISLQRADTNNQTKRLIKAQGEDSIKLLNDNGNKYFYSQEEGYDSSRLSLTNTEKDATPWQIILYGFEIEGNIVPVKSLEECDVIKPQESASCNQAIYPRLEQIP